MNDPILNKQITQAGVKIDSDERKKHIVKKNDIMKVDVPVCVSMASYAILELNV